MQSNAASLGVAGDADGHPRESAPTIDDSLHSSSDAYALADEEKTSQHQHQEPEQPSYYPPAAATNMQRSSSSATAKTTTTTTAPTHSAAMMTSSQPANKQQQPSRRQDSMDERRGPASVPHRQEDYGARHFDIEEEERETGWGLPGPVERPMLRALCLVSTRTRERQKWRQTRLT